MTQIFEILLQKKEAKTECERRLYITIADLYSRDNEMPEIVKALSKIIKRLDNKEMKFI